MPVASWAGFPAGGCGLERHRPSIPQPLGQHSFELGIQVTVRAGRAPPGAWEGRAGRGSRGPASKHRPQGPWTRRLSLWRVSSLIARTGWGCREGLRAISVLFPGWVLGPWITTWGAPPTVGRLVGGWAGSRGSSPAASEQTVACRRTSRRHTPQLPPASPPEGRGSGLSKPEERGSGLGKPEERASRLGKLHSERKSVEWSSLPLVGTSSSGSSASDSGSRLLRKVTGRPPQAPSHISSEQIPVRPGSSVPSSQDYRPRSSIRGSQDSRPRSLLLGDSQVFRARSLLRISQDSRPRSSLRSSTKDSKASEGGVGGLPAFPLPPAAPGDLCPTPQTRPPSCLAFTVAPREAAGRLLPPLCRDEGVSQASCSSSDPSKC